MKYFSILFLCLLLFNCKNQPIAHISSPQEERAKFEMYRLRTLDDTACTCKARFINDPNKIGLNPKYYMDFLTLDVNIDDVKILHDTVTYFMRMEPVGQDSLTAFPASTCRFRNDYYGVAFKKDSLYPIHCLVNDGAFSRYGRKGYEEKLDKDFRNCITKQSLNPWLKDYLQRIGGYLE